MTQPEGAPAQFDIDDAPENGVAEVRPPREETEQQSHRKDKGKRHAPQRPVGAPPRSFAESNAFERTENGKPGKLSEKDSWPTQAGPLWLTILDWLKEEKIGDEQATPDDILIGVDRISGGGQTGSATLDPPIEGSQVAGDENESAAAALMRVVTDTFHLSVSDDRARATFRLRFYWRRGAKGTIKQSESFTLDMPRNIRKMRLAASQEKGTPMPNDPLVPAALMDGRPIPPGTDPELLLELGELRAKVHGAQSVKVPAVGAQPADWEARLRLERDLVDAKAQAKAADDARAAAEKHAAEKAAMQKQIDDLRAAQEKAEVQRQLDELKAAINKPAQADDARLAAVMLQQLQALGLVKVGPDGKPQAVGAGQPYQPPEVTPEQQIAAAAKVLADAETSKQKAREVVARAMGLEEPRTEIEKPEPEKPPEPTMLDKALGMVGSALKGAVQNPEGPLSALAYIAKGSPLGEMAETAAKAVAAGRSAVSAHRATATPPAGGTPPGWKPSA